MPAAGRVGEDERVVVKGRTDVDADVAWIAVEPPAGVIAGTFEAVPGLFEQEALLRMSGHGVPEWQREGLEVELIHPVDERTPAQPAGGRVRPDVEAVPPEVLGQDLDDPVPARDGGVIEREQPIRLRQPP